MKSTTEERLIDAAFLMLLLLALTMMCVEAKAEPTIVFLNKCVDIDYTNPDWTCLNLTQAAQKAETRAQVNRACRGRKCPTIYSIDPKRPDKDTWLFGAWHKKGKVYFSYARMPQC